MAIRDLHCSPGGLQDPVLGGNRVTGTIPSELAGGYGLWSLRVEVSPCQTDLARRAVLGLGAVRASRSRVQTAADCRHDLSQLSRLETVPMPRVRDAVRKALCPGDRLFTPARKPLLLRRSMPMRQDFEWDQVRQLSSG